MTPLLLLLVAPVLSGDVAGVGSAIRRAGDVDRDGVPDVAVADRRHGAVWVLSGRNGDVIHRLASDTTPRLGTSLVTVGDVDGDSHPDLLVGAGTWEADLGTALVFSGRNGTVLHELRSPRKDPQFGTSVGGGHDVDGDEVPDLVVGEPSTSRSRYGRAYLFSGATARLLRTYEGTPRGSRSWSPGEEAPAHRSSDGELRVRYGLSVALIPDVDGDGRGELAVGCEVDRPSTMYLTYPTGYVEVLDSCRGSVLHRFDSGEHDYYALGTVLGSAGDVDGDGVADLYCTSIHTGATVYSGRTGKTIQTVRYTPEYSLDGDGHSMDGVGDLDGDGRADFAVGSNDVYNVFADAPGLVRVYAGSDGRLLWQWSTEEVSPTGGAAGDGADVCGAGDVDGDGTPDLAIYWERGRSVRIVSGRDFSLLFSRTLDELQPTSAADPDPDPPGAAR